jgi:protein-disulfide isomerase
MSFSNRLLHSSVLGLISSLCLITSLSFAQEKPEISETDGVAILVFSAFDCSYCARSHRLMADLHSRYGSRVTIIYKHFPLQNSDLGFAAHEAALAAAAQGKGQAMQDALFKNQAGGFERSKLDSIARTVGLDMRKFKRDMDSGAWRGRIQQDLLDARALKVEATPTFFVDGYKLEGMQKQELFSQIIDYKLAKAGPERRANLLERLATTRREAEAQPVSLKAASTTAQPQP